MKRLIIAEKPSVAADLSKAIGKVKKVDDYYEGDGLIIASAVGHLVELFMPQDIDPKLKAWSLKTLPILPERFQLKPIEKMSKKFISLKKLLGRKDVGEVVNACDAGREGELIFTYIYELAGCKKPIKRMWMLSMTKEGILKAYKDLREGAVMLPLQDAARCRSESDWLIGINGTRVITSRLFGFKGGQAATVGRVQTPTLALVVEREREIREFIPQTYWKVGGKFQVEAGEYEGFLQRKDYKEALNKHDRADRFWDKDTLELILKEIQKPDRASLREEKKRSTQAAPRLYDLTTLQREANNRFGLPAGRTLQILQSLYERHKMITYPRTDSNALPEDYVENCKQVLQQLKTEFKPFSQTILDKHWVNGSNKRIFNNAQVSDHFAITPTTECHADLTHDEAKIYDMIVRRFLAIFYPSAEYDITTRYSDLAGYSFKTEGKVLVVPGWLAVYGKEALQGEASLPPIGPKDGSPPEAKVLSVEAHTHQTTPPPHYSEATLLAAMEGAGKLVEDEELSAAMKDKGLGTPATRAQTIDHLIHEKYLERHHRDIISTTKAEHLIDFLKAIRIEALTSPALTGEWEFKLRQIEQGKLTRGSFMGAIGSLTTDIVEKAKNFDETNMHAEETDLLSPIDGTPLLDTIRAYRSKDGAFVVNKVIGNRRIEPEEVRKLIKDGKIGPLDGFRSKQGKAFSAILKLDEEHKVRFVFDAQAIDEAHAHAELTDLNQYKALGICPKCTQNPAGQVYELPTSYACEHQVKKDGTCNFRLSRVLLERAIEPEQFIKLIEDKKTDLLDKFRSKRTGRYFSAHLVLKNNAEIGFEFAAKDPSLAKRSAKTKEIAGDKPSIKATKASKKETISKAKPSLVRKAAVKKNQSSET